MLHAQLQKINTIAIRSLVVATLLCLASAIILGCYVVYVQTVSSSSTIFPGVYINNVDFSHKTKNDVQAHFVAKTDELKKISFEFTFEDTPIATFSGAALQIRYDGKNIAHKAYSLGRDVSSLEGLVTFMQLNLLHQRKDLYTTPLITLDDVQIALESFSTTHNKEPQDALFHVENGKVSAFKIDEPGYHIRVDKALDAIKKDVQTIQTSPTQQYSIALTKEIKQPAIKLSDINSFGIVEIIGSGQSNYTGSSSERKHNVLLAAQKMHGILIPPNGIFSYNNALGDVSIATGYKQAYVIKEGKTVLGDGGGICQISTTLFRAALNTGLPIIKRKAHAYRVHYYENDQKPGLDATVYAPSVDFQFKNDTGTHILIQTRIDQDKRTVTFDFYGKNDGRQVTLSPIKIWDIQKPPEPTYIDDPTLPRGTQKQTEYAALGTKSSFSYLVKKGNEVLQDRTFLSVYRPWGAVFMVGTKD